MAQSVERRLGKAEVGSSNLLGSLNHEAFRNIREAFFRVTGNSCYVKGHERNTDAQRFCMEYVSFADQNHAPSLTDVRLELFVLLMLLDPLQNIPGYLFAVEFI